MRTLLLLTLQLLACVSSYGINSVNYRFETYDTNMGLSSNMVQAIACDSMGYMWFGTNNGLNRSDGVKIESFYHAKDGGNQIRNNFVTSIHVSPDNEVWIGHREGIDIYSYVRGNGDEFRAFDTACGEIKIDRRVNNISTDKDDNILISTADYGAFVYYTKSDILVSIDEGYRTEGEVVNNMFVDNSNNIWVVYQGGNVLYYNQTYGKRILFTDRYRVRSVDSSVYDDVIITTLRGWVRAIADQNSSKVYFVSAVDGVVAYDFDNEEFSTIFKGSIQRYVQTINHLAITSDSKLYIAGKGGVAELDCRTKQLLKIAPTSITDIPLIEEGYGSLYLDNSSNLWCGTNSLGVYHHASLFELSQVLALKSVGNIHITSLLPLNSGEYLIGTDGRGVFSLNAESERCVAMNGLIDLDYAGVACTSDSRVFIYAPYRNRVLVYDKESKRCIDEIDIASVFSLTAVSDSGEYLIGTDKELFKYNSNDRSISKVNFSKSIIPVSTIAKLDSERIIISTLGQGCYIISTENNSVIEHIDALTSLLPYNYVTTLTVDGDRVWIGTEGEGFVLYNVDDNSFTRPIASETLKNSVICKILRWKEFVWIVSQTQIYKFILRGDDIIYESSFMLNKNVMTNCVEINENGKIYLGSLNGLVSFDCKNANVLAQRERVNISDVLIFNKSKEGYSCYDSYLELDHNESTISFAMDSGYSYNSNGVEYEYMLSGVDNTWRRTTLLSNVITYANLSPGEYTFYVRRANSASDSEAETTTLKLTIAPPIYRTIWAYLIYSVIVISIWWRIYSGRRKRRELKFRQEIERVQNANERNLQKFRLDFFSKVTHELRTPLTLIMTPVLQLMSRDSISKEDKSILMMVHNNCNRLQTITNQLLDFKDTRNLSYEINPSRFDLLELINNIANQYKTLGEQRDINVVLEVNEDSIDRYSIYSDSEAITKIVTNLLNNAIKFTNSLILVNLSQITGRYKITVTDNGKGIADDEYEKIFELYYQQSRGEHKGGFGIGLSLSKTLSELLEGELYVEQSNEQISKQGATFTLILPCALSGEEQDSRESCSSDSDDSVALEYEELDTEESGTQRVLIVDDEEDMRILISQILSDRYDCFTVASAEEAIDFLAHDEVSLIISDVMMGGMNGYEFCKAVRSNINTSHIPIILLTVRNSADDHIKGFKSGADGYLFKPFHPQLLHSRIDQIFFQRQELIKRYVTSPLLDASMPSATSRSDNALIERATQAVLDNLTNVEYNLDNLSQDLNISRSTLYAKMKAIVGMSGNTFIRHIRLKEACRLMNEGETRITTVCYSVGFNTPSYFSKCFAKQYGVQPLEYVKRLDRINTTND